jgi:rod shape-determining protein MreC
MVVRKRFLKWVAAAILLLLLFALPDGKTARFKGLFLDLLTPVQGLLVKSVRSLKEGADTVRGFGGLLEKNSRLGEELIYLQARLIELENLEQQNLHLQRQLGFHSRQKQELIPCLVISRSISGWWHSVRLDKGRSQGVVPNRAVLSPDGLVGRTDTVSAFTAEVLLISDPACKVSARISRTGSFGLVSGLGVNAAGYPLARIRFIHKDVPVRAGDAVVTSGLGGVFPKDVLIGYVETYGLEEGGLYQYADLVPRAVAGLMDVVFVAADGGPAEAEQ